MHKHLSTPPQKIFSHILEITPHEAKRYKELRLRGLNEHPEAFGELASDFEQRSVEDIAHQIDQRGKEGSFILAASSTEGELVGCVGLGVSQHGKSAHRGFVWGMYVLPEARNQGVAKLLINKLIERASQFPALEQLHLNVVTTNTAAARLYEAAGFSVYGTDPRVLKIDQNYYDEYLMVFNLK
jgi:RimJ/RimL family protein N-acetyltransferase